MSVVDDEPPLAIAAYLRGVLAGPGSVWPIAPAAFFGGTAVGDRAGWATGVGAAGVIFTVWAAFVADHASSQGQKIEDAVKRLAASATRLEDIAAEERRRDAIQARLAVHASVNDASLAVLNEIRTSGGLSQESASQHRIRINESLLRLGPHGPQNPLVEVSRFVAALGMVHWADLSSQVTIPTELQEVVESAMAASREVAAWISNLSSLGGLGQTSTSPMAGVEAPGSR